MFINDVNLISGSSYLLNPYLLLMSLAHALGTSQGKFTWRKILFFLMFPMLIYVMPNAFQKVNQREQLFFSSVGDLKEML